MPPELSVAVGALVLLLGGELLVRGAAALARSLGVPVMLVGLTVVAYGTSAPEFVVSITAAWQDKPSICAGNVVGSNILNVLLVVGVTALICPLAATASYVRREMPVMVGASILIWVFAFDRSLARWEAGVLLGLLAGYTIFTIQLARRARRSTAKEFEDMPQVRPRSIAVDIVLLVVGIGLLAIGSRWFLEGAVDIATRLGISEAIIGLTLVAAGTSLPELAASVIAAWRKHPDICLGNVIGSSIYNILGIAGAAGMVTPLPFDAAMVTNHMPVMVGSAVILWTMIYTGFRISRREGLVLVGIYAAYLAWTVRQALAS